MWLLRSHLGVIEVTGRCKSVLQPIPRSPLSFGFQLQCFSHVLCDTCGLPAAYLPFALMAKWTPSPCVLHTRARTCTHVHPLPLLYSIAIAATMGAGLQQAFLLVNYYGCKESTCSGCVYGLLPFIYIWPTFVSQCCKRSANRQELQVPMWL